MKLLFYEILAPFGIQLKCVTSCAVRDKTHTLLAEPVILSIALHLHTRNLNHRFISYNCKIL